MVGMLHGVCITEISHFSFLHQAVCIRDHLHVSQIERAMSSMAMGVLVTRMICVWQHGSNGTFGKDGCLSARKVEL